MPGLPLPEQAGGSVAQSVENDYHQREQSREILCRKGISMTQTMPYETVQEAKKLVNYEEGKTVQKMLLDTGTTKIVAMAMNKSGLAPHTAPGDALIQVLKGTAVLEYEGRTHILSKGDVFLMKKGALHSVHTDSKFKMLLTIAMTPSAGNQA